MWRRPAHPRIVDYDPDLATFAYRESEDAFDGGLAASAVQWLSSPAAIQAAELKMAQLSMAAALAVPYPPTIVTNAPHVAITFLHRHGAVVVKPVRYGLLTDGNEAKVAWTSRVNEVDLNGLVGPPVILQKEIKAAWHLRTVTVGDDVFVSQLKATELDWRSHLANHDRFFVADPRAFSSARAGALRMATAFHLGFTSQDWIADEAGDAWFLDLNPSGQWLFVDPAHNGAITSAIATALLARSRVSP